jgi:hypothetical protein
MRGALAGCVVSVSLLKRKEVRRREEHELFLPVSELLREGTSKYE